MGNKVSPKALRLGYLYSSNLNWFADKKRYPAYLKQDISIIEFLQNKLKQASVADIRIERERSNITINIFTSKPGLIISRSGKGVTDLKDEIKQKFLDKKTILSINIKEVDKPELSSALIAQCIVEKIEKRMPHRRVMKEAIANAEQAGVKGIKILLAGRLDGAEIARSTVLSSGRMPLSTLRADIDFSKNTAHMTYGTIGVKVWVYKGEIFK